MKKNSSFQLLRRQVIIVGLSFGICLSLLVIHGSVLSDTVSAYDCNADDVLCVGGCTAISQCVGGFRCMQTVEQLVKPPSLNPRPIRVLSPSTTVACSAGQGQAVLGGIEIPVGVWQYTPIGLQTSESIGIVGFASVLLKVFTIICGLWFMFNVIFAGFLFISSSTDSATFGKVKDSLYFSLIGLFLLAIAYMVAGVIGTIFFGNAGFILNPTLTQAGTTTAP